MLYPVLVFRLVETQEINCMEIMQGGVGGVGGGGGVRQTVQSITFVNRFLCLAARAHPVRLRCLATLPVFQYTFARIETAARNLVRIFFSSVRQALMG